jgi:hypothetical protein
MMDTLEKFYICRETEANNQINDKLTVQNNVVFKTKFMKTPIGNCGPSQTATPGQKAIHHHTRTSNLQNKKL